MAPAFALAVGRSPGHSNIAQPYYRLCALSALNSECFGLDMDKNLHQANATLWLSNKELQEQGHAMSSLSTDIQAWCQCKGRRHNTLGIRLVPDLYPQPRPYTWASECFHRHMDNIQTGETFSYTSIRAHRHQTHQLTKPGFWSLEGEMEETWGNGGEMGK